METEINQQEKKEFLPAAGKNWLLPLYDPLSQLFGIEAYRERCLREADLASHHYVLDVGCGTGSLVKTIVRRYPFKCLFAIDPDDGALRIARNKVGSARNVQFKSGLADQLDFPEHFFHRVFSTFVFHHLTQQEQVGALTEIRRVLSPGGRFHLLDFEQWHKRKSSQSPNAICRPADYPELLEQCGFNHITQRKEKHLLLGSVSLLVASI
jgi:ubiquinone/menaquinone biosynthesis C-methylase UbiE